MSDVQLTVVEGDVAQVIGAIPGPQGPAGAVAAAIDGSAALPSIAFASDTDTGLYRVGANQLGVSTGGTQRLVIDETGQIEATSLGTAAAPTWTFVGDPDTGAYSPGANQFAISTGGTGRLFVDANGRVGIGTASPADALHVNGGYIRIQRDAPQIFFRSADGASNQYYIGANISDAVDGGFVIGEGANISSGTPRIIINGAGSVCIGTSSPSERLTVLAPFDGLSVVGGFKNISNVSVNTAAAIELTADQSTSRITTLRDGAGNSATTVISNTAAGVLGERLRITSTGNVGIGTSSPSGLLDVSGGYPSVSNNSDDYRLRWRRTDGSFTGGLKVDGFHKLTLALSDTAGTTQDRMVVDSSGRVGIGTVSPQALLHSATSDNNIRSFGASGTARGVRIVHTTARSSIDGVDQTLQTSYQPLQINGSELYFAVSDSEKARFDSSGRLGIGTVNPATALDVVGAIRSTSGTIDARLQAGYAGAVGIGAQSNDIVLFIQNATERARIDSSGRLLVGTSTNTGGSLFQINDNRIRIATAKTPASATDTGSAGEICWDANYIYVCTATNTWKRTALATW